MRNTGSLFSSRSSMVILAFGFRLRAMVPMQIGADLGHLGPRCSAILELIGGRRPFRSNVPVLIRKNYNDIVQPVFMRARPPALQAKLGARLSPPTHEGRRPYDYGAAAQKISMIGLQGVGAVMVRRSNLLRSSGVARAGLRSSAGSDLVSGLPSSPARGGCSRRAAFRHGP